MSTLTVDTAPLARALPWSTRTTRDDVASIPSVLRSELIKMTSLRANKAIGILVTAIGAFASWAVATLVTDEVLVVSKVFIFSTVLTAVFSAITGILVFTSEAQHGTLATSLTAQPARWVIVLSKAVMAAARGLVLGALGMLGAYAGAVFGGLDMGDTSDMPATALYGLLFTTLAAVFGLGVGMIVRHGSGAIAGLLVWGLVIENLFTLFLPARIARFLPFVAGNNLLAIKNKTASAETIAAALTRPENAFVYGGYTSGALLIGAVLLYRRDTN